MMLLDGCLIVELLCGRAHEIDSSFNLGVQNVLFPTEEFGPIFNLGWVRNALFHDMLLLENQLPYKVLVKLYMMIEDSPSDGDKNFAQRAFCVLRDLLPGPKKWIDNHPTIQDIGNIKHLLSLVHDNWSPSPQGIKCHQEYLTTTKESGQDKWKFTLCAAEKSRGDKESDVTNKGEHSYFKWNFISCAREKEKVRKVGWKPIRCAKELKEAGICFVNSTEDSKVESLFDISFSNGKMKIPTFVIDDYTKRLFRNLIAYEQYDEEGPTYVRDYVILMDCLINSSGDVQLLRLREIIENLLGYDDAVAQMINKLCKHVIFSPETFYYKEIFDKVAKHCAKRWNIWRAKLLRDYFHSP